jgi:hypothetical protein
MSETGMAMMGSGSASGEDRAREAAEAAISSPLLEDINLAGAQGILVNVTAGMDLSIGEFQEVGNVIKQFASDDATVVVGTVIDPEMANQIRVTVVATGLGRRWRKAPHRSRSRDDRTAAAEPSVWCGSGADGADRLRDARQADGAAQRAVGDGLRTKWNRRIAGHSGVPAPAGGLMTAALRSTFQALAPRRETCPVGRRFQSMECAEPCGTFECQLTLKSGKNAESTHPQEFDSRHRAWGCTRARRS